MLTRNELYLKLLKFSNVGKSLFSWELCVPSIEFMKVICVTGYSLKYNYLLFVYELRYTAKTLII